jgi:alkylated DNA repair protein alkB homolog 8
MPAVVARTVLPSKQSAFIEDISSSDEDIDEIAIVDVEESVPHLTVTGTGSKGSKKFIRRKFVYLPPRSLLLMQGAARYHWSHGIVPRTVDKVQGLLLPRSRRVSLTFRQVMLPGDIPSNRLRSSELEEDHVFKVYDSIAVHWNHTRGKRKVHWHRVKDFLEMLPTASLVADVGCGDGKYFNVNPELQVIGCDRSLKLLEVSHEASHETFCCDAVKLPLRR